MISPTKVPVECAAILAGGASSRMGREKALIDWRGQPLISHVAAVLRPIFKRICVVTSQSEVARAATCEAIADEFPGRGPLGGIHAALSHFGAPTLVVACDMPFLNRDFLVFLSQNFERNALIALSERGAEPLHSVYGPSCLPLFETQLRSDGKTASLRRIIEGIDAQFVSVNVARRFDAQLRCYSNWNTPSDLSTGDESGAT